MKKNRIRERIEIYVAEAKVRQKIEQRKKENKDSGETNKKQKRIY